MEKVPSEKGPPRKVYSLTSQGRDYLDEFWKTWSFLSARLDQLQAAWAQIKTHLSAYSDLTGRNLMPILDGALGLLEETASDGQSVHDALGDDIQGFCAAIAGHEEARTYRDRWRRQLNRNVARKLARPGG